MIFRQFLKQLLCKHNYSIIKKNIYPANQKEDEKFGFKRRSCNQKPIGENEIYIYERLFCPKCNKTKFKRIVKYF